MIPESTGSFFDKALQQLLGPFQSWESVWYGVTHAFRVFGFDWGSKTALPYMLSSLLIAWLVYWYGRGAGSIGPATSFFRFVFPRDVYLHPSAITDYKFVGLDLTIKLLVYTPLVSGVSWVFYKVLMLGLAPIAIDLSSTIPFSVAVMPGVVAVLLGDFGFFFAHYLLHRIPLLWHFHQVHHSAEVLTPVTVYRIHPLEDLITGLVGSTVGAVGAATYSAITTDQVQFGTIFGVNAIMFFYFLVAFQLRHTHVWLSYGSILSRILISPAQHQIHHSKDPKHWDKNYGFTFAVWDALWGSLYVPTTREHLNFGIAGVDPEDFRSVSKLYVLPFKKAFRSLTTGKSGTRAGAPEEQVSLRTGTHG
jgi:sterol desaturase/sphingolipid hydroxylase (fatty acid hydroxylase superfamily)